MLEAMPTERVAMDFVCKGAHVGALADQARALGARVHHVPLRPSHIGYLGGLRQLIVEGRYDLVHDHLEAYSALPVLVARRMGVPVIASYHNTSFAAQTWTGLPVLRQLRAAYAKVSIACALRGSDLVTGCSRAVLASVDPDTRYAAKSRVLRYGIPLPEHGTVAARKAFRADLGIAEGNLVVLHVGRFAEQKNHAGLLRVFAVVLEHVPSAVLVLVGDGPLRAAIERQVSQMGLGAAVRFVGVRDDVPSIMACADVFLFPSRFEGFGLAAVEANAAALPVVGTDIPGLREAVQSGETALLHAVDDIQGMGQSVVRLAKDACLREAMGTRARERAQAYFSVTLSCEELLHVYEECRYARGK